MQSDMKSRGIYLQNSKQVTVIFISVTFLILLKSKLLSLQYWRELTSDSSPYLISWLASASLIVYDILVSFIFPY